ncbi:MAG: alpha/beta hydrolase [Austwickia sp.]|jgi:pimeloyl-ACP methyl ester carboxylesterase|nr:MAG: alpha/beta hydrolase [Austwickia sp.]
MAHDVEVHGLQRPGCRIHYLHRPSETGQWVVFLHGAGADAQSFAPQLKVVPEGVGILAWDARGHGRSQLEPGRPFRYEDMVEDLYALLDTYGVEVADFIGQSMGGNLAQTVTRRTPERVGKLVLIDCTDNYRRLWPSEKIGLALSKLTLRVWPWWGIVAATAAACGINPKTQVYTAKTMVSLGKPHFLEVINYWSDAHVDDSHPLGRPTLLVLGTLDMTGNIAYAMTTWPLKDPMAKLVIVPWAAHMSNRDQPWLVNRSIRKFLGWGATAEPADPSQPAQPEAPARSDQPRQAG